MLSYAEPEERDRIAELRRRTAAASIDEDVERIAALRRRTAASTPADDEDLQRVADDVIVAQFVHPR